MSVAVRETREMGRPRKRPPGKGKPGDKPEKPQDDRIAVINLKGSKEYAEWFDGLYEHTHISKAMLVRLGLAEMAKKYGYRQPPEL